jgi:xylitol oxidase
LPPGPYTAHGKRWPPRSSRTIRYSVEALRRLGEQIRPLVQISEIRSVAADALWMSPQYERDTVGLHFTWKPDQRAVEEALEAIEVALAPFDPRPHWGKLFLAPAGTLAPRYPRHADFVALVKRFDPREAFRNAWLERALLSPGAGGSA